MILKTLWFAILPYQAKFLQVDETKQLAAVISVLSWHYQFINHSEAEDEERKDWLFSFDF